MEELIYSLCSVYPLSELCKLHLRGIIKRETFKKGKVLLKEGQICKYIYFIESGLLRVHADTENGDVTYWILRANDFVVSVESFFDQVPAAEEITVIEDCVLYSISFEQMEATCRGFEDFHWVQTKIQRKYYVICYRRYKEMLGVPAHKRYLTLLERNPELFNIRPLGLVRTYLAIPKTTWIGIRKKIREGKYKIQKK